MAAVVGLGLMRSLGIVFVAGGMASHDPYLVIAGIMWNTFCEVLAHAR